MTASIDKKEYVIVDRTNEDVMVNGIKEKVIMVDSEKSIDNDSEKSLATPPFSLPCPVELDDEIKEINISDASIAKTNDAILIKDENSDTNKRLAKTSPKKQDQSKKEKIKLERQQKREMERLERENKKIQKEKERLEKKLKQEQEKELKRKKQEEERELKKRKLEEEREVKKRKLEEEKELKKKQQEEERLKKQSEKEAKEREKLEKQKAKEREKLAKERAQSKISNFFTVQKKITTSSMKKNDYDNTFLNFYVKPSCHLSKLGRLEQNHLEHSKTVIDSYLINFTETSTEPSVIAWLNSNKQQRGHPPLGTAQKVVASINNESLDEQQILQMVNNIPLKFLQFYENIKPAYCGTFSKKNCIPTHNPFFKAEDIDYEYESDFEDEGDEEGDDIEDIDDEDEDEDEGEDNSDLDDFLEESDDKVNTNNKRPIVVGKLTPLIQLNNPESADPVFANMTADILQPAIEFPIDPFKNYWKSSQQSPQKTQLPNITTPTKETFNSQQTDSSKPAAANNLLARKKPKTIITNQEELQNFIRLVHENNEFTLSTLVEILKKKFPDYTKITVKNTLEHVASKKGPKATEKKWVINDQFQSQLVQT